MASMMPIKIFVRILVKQVDVWDFVTLGRGSCITRVDYAAFDGTAQAHRQTARAGAGYRSATLSASGTRWNRVLPVFCNLAFDAPSRVAQGTLQSVRVRDGRIEENRRFGHFNAGSGQ